MPRGPDGQLLSRRARRGGLEAGMRFLEPPRRKGGPAAAAPLSLLLLAGGGQTPLPACFPVGKGLEAPWQRVRSRWRATESILLLLAAALDVQPGFGESLLNSEHRLLSWGCSWTEMVSCLLSWLLQQQPWCKAYLMCQGFSGTPSERGHGQPFPAVLRSRLQPFRSSC